MGRTGLIEVEERIEAARVAAGRSDPITLVVVTKYAADDAVAAAIAEGASELGESRSDSLCERVPKFEGVSWHFIGKLQRNKVKEVRPVVALLQSMDRLSLAQRWATDLGPPVPVLIEVNLAEEPQKAGVAPGELDALVEGCRELGVEVRGLMTVPPRPEHPADSARWFDRLRSLRDQLREIHPKVVELSMGMSDDFEVAIGEGATILRVGRAIFDPFRNEG